jgi:ferredoxin--NADP+ reductase
VTSPTPNAQIIQWRDVHANLAIFRVQPDEPNIAPFEPGQYATLGLELDAGTVVQRALTIASDASDRASLEFYVVRIDEGAWTTKLFETRQETRFHLQSEIEGAFTLSPVDPTANVVFVATGTGLAPYMSMIRSFASEHRPWGRLALLHGVRHEQDLGYRAELEVITATEPTIQYLPIVSRQSDFDGHTGHVGDLLHGASLPDLMGFELDPASSHVFLCGNPAMVDEQAQLLGAKGFAHFGSQGNPDGRLHYEKYW